MKLFFISDIHGSKVCLEKAMECFEKESADQLLILGDQLYHGPRNQLPEGYDPQGVAEILNSYKEKIIAVRGNCDSEVDQMILEYPMMSDNSYLLLDGRKFFLAHGHMEQPKNLLRDCVYAQGHTHVPVIEERKGVYFFNPGSISLPKSSFENSYGVYSEETLFVRNFNGDTILEKKLK